MKKNEKITAAIVTIVVGILMLILRGELIGILMTVLGVCLIALGILDLVHHKIAPAIVKLAAGVVVIVLGWTIVEIVLYIVGALLIIAGVMSFYEKYRSKTKCKTALDYIKEYALSVVLFVVGVLLLFCQGAAISWIFVVCGILTILEGALLLYNAIKD